ncbi:hypothetical protein HDV64DRAFT_165158 [Trichoderma sp. TUCIM 5745]
MLRCDLAPVDGSIATSLDSVAIVPEPLRHQASLLPIFPLIRPICFPLFLATPQIFAALCFFPLRLYVPALGRLKRVTLPFCRVSTFDWHFTRELSLSLMPVSNGAAFFNAIVPVTAAIAFNYL